MKERLEIDCCIVLTGVNGNAAIKGSPGMLALLQGIPKEKRLAYEKSKITNIESGIHFIYFPTLLMDRSGATNFFLTWYYIDIDSHC